MEEKLLIGVAHKDIKELEEVIMLTNGSHPHLVGLELPEDYEEKESNGLTSFLFSDIAAYFRCKGANILPLEKPETWGYRMTIGLAIRIREGTMPEEIFQEDLRRFKEIANDYYQAPESRKPAELGFKRYSETAELLKKYSSQEELVPVYEDVIKVSDEQMLEKILKYNPDTIVIGLGHARNIKPNLPEYKLCAVGI